MKGNEGYFTKPLYIHFRNTSCSSISYIVCSIYEGHYDLMEHIMHMTSQAEQMHEMKEISSKNFAPIVLGSLPELYDTFITSLNARHLYEVN